MSLKRIIKTRICLPGTSPNYPLKEFVEWAEPIEKHTLLAWLDEVQAELDAEDARWWQRRLEQASAPYPVQQGYWCLYCAQIRAYYRAVIRNPSYKPDFLMWGPLKKQE